MDEAAAVAKARAILRQYPAGRWATLDRLIVGFLGSDNAIRWRAQVRRKAALGKHRAVYGPVRFTWSDAAADRAELEAAHPVDEFQNRPRKDDTMRRLVDMIGWDAETRRSYLTVPRRLDPLSSVGDAAMAMLGRTLTLDEMGTLYGLTRERIRQIEAKTRARLRRLPEGLALRVYLEGER